MPWISLIVLVFAPEVAHKSGAVCVEKQQKSHTKTILMNALFALRTKDGVCVKSVVSVNVLRKARVKHPVNTSQPWP